VHRLKANTMPFYMRDLSVCGFWCPGDWGCGRSLEPIPSRYWGLIKDSCLEYTNNSYKSLRKIQTGQLNIELMTWMGAAQKNNQVASVLQQCSHAWGTTTPRERQRKPTLEHWQFPQNLNIRLYYNSASSILNHTHEKWVHASTKRDVQGYSFRLNLQ
jgi:hypothetical protein